MAVKIVIEGLDELSARFAQFPDAFQRVMHKTMEASLLHLWGSVPEYPEPPGTSTYTRTGTLGRTLGSSEGGGRSGGKPDIYEVKQGPGYTEGEFGTNLSYAPYVIGDNEQAWMHRGRWWTIATVAERAKDGIERLFQAAAEEMARWLDGRGL